MDGRADDGRIASPYVLGHDGREIDRLVRQARIIDPITERFLRAAGISAGMRVLDVGSGAGDVAFLAADIVGETGEVVGVDRAPAAVEAATQRARGRALANVRFVAGDPAEMTFDQPFDAVVGRYVLQFQRDPVAMVRRVAGHVRAGGLVAFHELDWGGVGSFPPVPSYDRCCAWAVETLRRHGTETRMGTRLFSTFVAAGLTPPTMRLEALVAGGPASVDRLELAAGLLRTLLPEAERLGVVTANEVDIETLVDRMVKEAIATSSVVMGHFQIAAWSRV